MVAASESQPDATMGNDSAQVQSEHHLDSSPKNLVNVAGNPGNTTNSFESELRLNDNQVVLQKA